MDRLYEFDFFFKIRYNDNERYINKRLNAILTKG